MENLEDKIKQLIRERGPITFATFMEIALYDPEEGYYSLPKSEGAEKDYFTSPAAHPMFGVSIALGLWQMWKVLRKPAQFDVVELGAGSGLLCRDLLVFARNALPDLYEALRYVAVERQAQGLQQGVEEDGLTEKVQVVQGADMPRGPFAGCVLSNELVDSFPVHRATILGGELKEIFIGLHNDQLVEVLDKPSTPALAERLEQEGVKLGEGWQAEVGLEVGPWLANVARALSTGFVLTIDYGDVASGLYSERRRRGTLMSYHQHTAIEEPLQRIGKQDITAHVDFTAIAEEGRKVGLDPIGLEWQGVFLRNLGLDLFLRALEHRGLSQRELLANRMAMRELARSDGLGSFLVLAQAKGVGSPRLDGFSPDNETRRWLEGQGEAIYFPPLTPRHLRLLRGKYPAVDVEWGQLSD